MSTVQYSIWTTPKPPKTLIHHNGSACISKIQVEITIFIFFYSFGLCFVLILVTFVFIDDPVFVSVIFVLVLVYFLVLDLANVLPEVGKFLAKFWSLELIFKMGPYCSSGDILKRTFGSNIVFYLMFNKVNLDTFLPDLSCPKSNNLTSDNGKMEHRNI